MVLPNLTPEQHQTALAKAAAARRDRTKLCLGRKPCPVLWATTRSISHDKLSLVSGSKSSHQILNFCPS